VTEDSEYGSIGIGSAGTFLCGDVNIAVRSLPDVADSDTELGEQGPVSVAVPNT
jgi:hypothetical protein